MEGRNDRRITTEELGFYISHATPIEGRCPACGDTVLGPLGDDAGDAYEFMMEVGHPEGFDKVPFLAVACYCCGHVSWFLKDLVVDVMSPGVQDEP